MTDKVFITHGDSLEDAEYVGELVKEKFGITDITYSYISPAIGSHSGPGTVALFYLGRDRETSPDSLLAMSPVRKGALGH